MNYLNNLPEITIDFTPFFLEQNLILKKQIELQTSVFKTSLLDQTVAPSLAPLIVPSICFSDRLTLNSVAKCFDKAYTEVISSKNWTLILASYKYDETSIFGTLPQELIDSIFQIDRQINLFDKYNNKLASQGTAPEYTEQISKKHAHDISLERLSPSDAKKRQRDQDKCFL